MLRELDIITVILQGKCRSLVNCRVAIDTVLETIDDKNSNSEHAHPLYNCPFKAIRCDKNYGMGRQKWNDFESAVCKIQGHQEERLSSAEKIAIKKAAKGIVEESEVKAQPDGGSPGWAARIRRQEKRSNASQEEPESAYVNLDFVLVSAAEIERLWSKAKYAMADHRKKLSPQLFEILMSLKYNDQFWDDILIVQAHRNARDQKSTERYENWLKSKDKMKRR
jgi:hypothetical protein